MQTQKRKKKLKTKKDSHTFQPIKHEKFGNLNNYSEEIIKEIIDKGNNRQSNFFIYNRSNKN